MKISVSVALEQDMLARLEEARGQESRSAFVARALDLVLRAKPSGTGLRTMPLPAHVPEWQALGVKTALDLADGDYQREPFEG